MKLTILSLALLGLTEVDAQTNCYQVCEPVFVGGRSKAKAKAGMSMGMGGGVAATERCYLQCDDAPVPPSIPVTHGHSAPAVSHAHGGVAPVPAEPVCLQYQTICSGEGKAKAKAKSGMGMGMGMGGSQGGCREICVQFSNPSVSAPAPVLADHSHGIPTGHSHGTAGHNHGYGGHSHGAAPVPAPVPQAGPICLQFQTICSGGGKAMAKSGMSMGMGGSQGGCREVCVQFGVPPSVSNPTPIAHSIPASHSHGIPAGHSHGAAPVPAPVPRAEPICLQFQTICSGGGKAMAKSGMSMGMGGSQGGCREVCVQFGNPSVSAPAPVLADHSHGTAGHSHGGYGGHSHGAAPVPAPVPQAGPICLEFQTICSDGGKAMAKSGMSMGMGGSKGGCREVCVQFGVPPSVSNPAPIAHSIPSSHSHGIPAGHGHGIPSLPVSAEPVCLQFQTICTGGGKAMAKSGMSMGMGGSNGGCREVCIEFGVPSVPVPAPLPASHGHSAPAHDHSLANHSHGAPTHSHGGGHSRFPAPAPVPEPVPMPSSGKMGGGKMGGSGGKMGGSSGKMGGSGGKMGGGKMGGGDYSYAGDDYSYGGDVYYSGPIGDDDALCLRYETVCSGGKAMAKSGMSMMSMSGGGCMQVCVEFGVPPAPVTSPSHNHAAPSHSHSIPTHGHQAVPIPAPVPITAPVVCLQFQSVCSGGGGGKSGSMSMSMGSMGSAGGCTQVCVLYSDGSVGYAGGNDYYYDDYTVADDYYYTPTTPLPPVFVGGGSMGGMSGMGMMGSGGYYQTDDYYYVGGSMGMGSMGSGGYLPVVTDDYYYVGGSMGMGSMGSGGYLPVATDDYYYVGGSMGMGSMGSGGYLPVATDDYYYVGGSMGMGSMGSMGAGGYLPVTTDDYYYGGSRGSTTGGYIDDALYFDDYYYATGSMGMGGMSMGMGGSMGSMGSTISRPIIAVPVPAPLPVANPITHGRTDGYVAPIVQTTDNYYHDDHVTPVANPITHGRTDGYVAPIVQTTDDYYHDDHVTPAAPVTEVCCEYNYDCNVLAAGDDYYYDDYYVGGGGGGGSTGMGGSMGGSMGMGGTSMGMGGTSMGMGRRRTQQQCDYVCSRSAAPGHC